MEQIIDMRTTLRYIRVPIFGPGQMFGDDESIVNSSMKIHANSISNIMHYLSIKYINTLHQIFDVSIMYIVKTTPLISLANIGPIIAFGRSNENKLILA